MRAQDANGHPIYRFPSLFGDHELVAGMMVQGVVASRHHPQLTDTHVLTAVGALAFVRVDPKGRVIEPENVVMVHPTIGGIVPTGARKRFAERDSESAQGAPFFPYPDLF